MCKILPSMLCRNAWTWYYSLVSRSINSYIEMATTFAIKFSSRWMIKKTTPELMSAVQWKRESLKNYMNKFNDAVLKINSFDQEMGIAVIIEGLTHEWFRDNLIKHPPITFNEVNDWSWKFIIAKEYALSSKSTTFRGNRKVVWREEGMSRKKNKIAQNWGLISIVKFSRSEPITSQPQSTKSSLWTPFTLPKSQILM